MSYTQLTISDRFTLYELHAIEKLSIREIAARMKRSPSSISRELKRNRSNETHYLPDTAQLKWQERRQQAKQRFMSVSTTTLEQVKQRLGQYHSPEQIAGRLKREGLESISHETIYQMIYANYQGLGTYQAYLRQGRKQRRRRQNLKQKRGVIPDRIGIEQRPPIADEKTEIGHWEGDTVIGAYHTGVIVTHVDKASKFLLAGLAKHKSVAQINQVTLDLFAQIGAESRKTMTFDNGKEFSGHQKLSEALGVSCFFANPYHSWERGLNEHSNGLLRQFFPKGSNLRIVQPEVLQHVVNLINHRPRKSLDYRTPYEVLFSHTSAPVALQN